MFNAASSFTTKLSKCSVSHESIFAFKFPAFCIIDTATVQNTASLTLLAFKIPFFFFFQELPVLKRQQICKISEEWELRDCKSCAGINLSHENIWMWGRVDIILPVAGEHKRKTTVQLVRITTHEHPWVDIYYKTLLCLGLPSPVGRLQKMLCFETMLMVFAIL